MGNGAGSKLKQLYQAVSEFLTEKWLETGEEVKVSRLHRFAHFWLLVFKSFSRNRCPLRATALAYTTLLALVPLLAVAVSITTSLLQEKGEQATRDMIKRFVETAVPQLQLMSNNPEEAQQIDVVEQITKFISNINTKTLGVTGIFGLIVVGIMLLSSIEDTFNDIWGVVRGRSWLRRIVQYWTTISLGPIVLALLIVHVGNTFFSGSKHDLSTFGFVVQLLPSFLLVSIAFGIIYKLMPNTPVHWTAALIGGIVGGSLWLLLNIFNAFNLSRVVSMSVIYGSVLATIPIFLVGLYFSWLIVLFGAQVAYAFQNRIVYVQTKKAETVNQRGREYVALRTMVYIAQRFEQGLRPPTLQQIGEQLSVPSRLIVLVMQPLAEARLALEAGGEGETGYVPARPIETITCHDIIETFRGSRQDLETRDDAAHVPVCREFNRIFEAQRKAATGTTLKDMVLQLADQESKVTNIAELQNRKKV